MEDLFFSKSGKRILNTFKKYIYVKNKRWNSKQKSYLVHNYFDSNLNTLEYPRFQYRDVNTIESPLFRIITGGFWVREFLMKDFSSMIFQLQKIFSLYFHFSTRI